ncbi:hypothetical protein [Flavivirga spongiicola]|uniref:Uncharacterized protein n=1 Tax=Flavivirga spongiicola TaxID=421621 RepID=A0ABU7Y0R5_9FLAO|nr:hypothetical protein [Flavivirga sp. MEBiC05379]MDO5980836.1 hypothetical protein [Flavivirga sp. MEBiC05379]
MKYEYNLRERSEIVFMATKAVDELDARELIDWFEKAIENKRRLNLIQIEKALKRY